MIFNRLKSQWRTEGLPEVILLTALYKNSINPLQLFEPICLFLTDQEFPRIMPFALMLYGYVEDETSLFLHCPFIMIINTVKCLSTRPFCEKFMLAHILVKTWDYMAQLLYYEPSLEIWLIEINIIL
jgi:hypothetical protein